MLRVTALNDSPTNPAMEKKFKIYLKAIGAAKKPDKMRVGLLSNHIGESFFSKFTQISFFIPKGDDPSRGDGKLPAENPDNYTKTGPSTHAAREILGSPQMRDNTTL